MINYSVWNFKKFKSLEEFLEAVNDNKISVRNSTRSNLELKSEIISIDGFEMNKIRQISIDDLSVPYIIFDANAQGYTKNVELNTYEVKDFQKRIIVYENDGIIKVVVQASQSDSERIIKKVFNNKDVWGIITKNQNILEDNYIIEDNYVTEDMLYWMFYILREMPDRQINTNPDLYLNGIVSYLGKTNDKINAVRGIGIRVSALLGTLGMLLGEESLKALRPIVQYGLHEINIEMNIGNAGRLYERSYQGPLIEFNKTEFEIALVLLVCKYILPNIRDTYKDDVDKKEWSLHIRQVFMRAIGNEMSEKVNRELELIERQLKQLEKEDDTIDFDNFDNLNTDNFFNEEDFEELDDLEDEIKNSSDSKSV